MKCKICYNTIGNKAYEVREMMFGYRDKFIYFQCSKCLCLQISNIPGDMSKYYPSNYYSFQLFRPDESKKSIKELIKKQVDKYATFNKGVSGQFIYTIFPDETLRMLSRTHSTKNTAILDVGCGNGSLLFRLREIGFEHLLGIDPYITEALNNENGLKFSKNTIHDINGKWDIIMFHHSFEHIPDPLETLQSVSRSLTNGGICFIRIPTVSSYAWEHYKVNWVQLDAPRHFFLHSIESITILAEKVNLVLEEIAYDSTIFQFWGSEQLIKDIPLTDPRSYWLDSSIFTDKELRALKQKAKKLNLNKRGDSAAFILRKK